MVGFGSSLRMSRRRGWEDAYLDYASLRLLLTQIEAVYEEEDWKRGAPSSNNSLTHHRHDDDELGWLGVNNVGEGEEELSGLAGGLWRLFSRPHRRRKRVQRRRMREQQTAAAVTWESMDESSTNWVVSADNRRISPRRNKKDKASHALDKRGWRSPGVTDYRDELFLVSDDDIAFGCDEEEDTWEDIDAEDSSDEVHDEYERMRVDSSSSDYENLNVDMTNQENDRLQSLAEEQRSHSGAGLDPTELQVNENDDLEGVGRSNHNLPYSIPESPDANPDESNKGLDTIASQSSHPETPVSENASFVDTTRSKYETFASVAARRGVAHTNITSGSPEQSWLDFIPDFLGKKSNKSKADEQSRSKDTKVLSPATSPALGFAESVSPSKSHHSPIATDSTLKYRYDEQRTPLYESESSEPITPNSLYTSHFKYKPAATALGSSMPTTPMSLSPVVEKATMTRKQSTDGSGFGVSLNSSLLPSNETTGLLTSSSTFKTYGQQHQQSMTPTRDNRTQYQFYSFQDNHDQSEDQPDADESQRRALDFKRNQNMFSYYNDGYFSVRAQNTQQQHQSTNAAHLRLPSLASVPEQQKLTESAGNFVMNLLLGRVDQPEVAVSQRNIRKASSRRKNKDKIRRQRERMRRKRQLQRRRELVPENLRVAHVRASAITERFRGLLRAEVEKIILFANSRLGELSDTIGSLRYSSYEEGNQSVRTTFPNLDDGGLHPCSSSEDDEGDSVSCASSDEDHRHQQIVFDESDRDKKHHRYQSDSSNDTDAVRRQLIARDRLRISRPLFSKAGFLGEDFSLLSAVDEADAYTAIGVELMHLLKFLCVNIIAVRKICRKHDRLLSNRMLGDYYHQQIKQNFQSTNNPKSLRNKNTDLIQAPQFGLLLSKPTGLETTGGYTVGIFDAKIQEIANSTTMQTVSSTLAVALAEAEASQSRSMQITLSNELGPTLESKSTFDEAEAPSTPEMPSPKQSPFQKKRLRDAVSYQIGGHCFRVDDESSEDTPVQTVEDEHAKDVSLTRLQYVVTSVFGLREAARNRSTTFEHHASRLFMFSVGPNIVGDGLTGCARETLDFMCSYNPDKAYLLSADSLYSALKSGKEKALGFVMTSTLSAAANQDAATLAIGRNVVGSQEDSTSSYRLGCRHILRLNTVSLALFTANYYVTMPSAYMFTLELGTMSSQSLLSAISNASSLIACFAHALLLSKRYSFMKGHIMDLSFFRGPLIVSSLFSIFGNMIYSYSLSLKSFRLALLGRFLFGFGSCELLNRHLLSVALPNDAVNREVASFAKTTLAATAVGLLFGSIFDLRVKNDVLHFLDPVGVRTTHLAATMIQNISDLASLLTIPDSNVSGEALNSSAVGGLPPVQNVTASDVLPTAFKNSTTTARDIYLPPLPLPSSSLQVHLPFGEHRLISVGNVGYILAALWSLHLIALLFFYEVPKRSLLEDHLKQENQALPERADEDEDMDTFADSDDNVFANDGVNTQENETLDGTFEKLQTMSRRSVNYGSKHSYVESVHNISRLVLSNVAFPTTAAVLFLVKATIEVVLCSGGTILNRYFAWSGALAGLFMGVVASVVLPINAHLADEKNLVERKIIKDALRATKYGIFFMINYEAIFLLIRNMIRNEKKWVMPAIYDDVFGILQYLIGFCVVFVSVSFLESSTLTLMSKVSPLYLKRYSIDNSFIVIVLTLAGRLIGDLLISAVDVSSWVFCSDIINSLMFPLLVGFMAGEYLVRKHYFFLI